MAKVSILPPDSMSKNFIPDKFLPAGKDEYYLRNTQTLWDTKRWRHLQTFEIERLERNNNTCSDWNEILVTEKFDPSLISNSKFYGFVRIGDTENIVLEYNGLKLPAGIKNSMIISCDIGDNAAIHDVGYLSHFIIGNRCIIYNVAEINTSNTAKFGNGIVKEGESEEELIWLDLMNEAGGRRVLPFDGMIAADAYLWAKYRDDSNLQNRLKDITQNGFDPHRGYYTVIGDQCVIKNSRTLKDVKIGSNCYIKGVNILKNLTINSSEEEPTQIGEGVELVNGIVGYGCHIYYGCKAVRFILGNNSNLKYGTRVINSLVGDNSTISCCVVLNNLIFPAHEQHHNNSFLIASLVMGQSNIAAGATIGSNHNSRANDNEIQAGRGFWPGLCASLKHPSRFASFVLISKGDYPSELDIPLPFSLINNNVSLDQLEVMPAFWWMYNMYALTRNSGKYKSRDKRKHKIQNIEYDALAPDTVEEIITACHLLEIWTAKAWIRNTGENSNTGEKDLINKGRELLNGPSEKIKNLEVTGENMERSNRKVVIIKVQQAYKAYKDMLHYYCMKNLTDYDSLINDMNLKMMHKNGIRISKWVNFGGQLIPEHEADRLREDISSGTLNSWQDVHNRYNDLWNSYQHEKQKHAYSILCVLLGKNELAKQDWIAALDKSISIQEYVCEQVYISRKKDFDNKFIQSTFRNPDEMRAVIGNIDDNSFVKQVRKETEEFKKRISELKKRE